MYKTPASIIILIIILIRHKHRNLNIKYNSKLIKLDDGQVLHTTAFNVLKLS